MRYTRVELVSTFKGLHQKSILGYFVIIPIVSILLGGIISFIFVPQKTNINVYTKKVISKKVINKQALKYYALQLGVFKQKSNAKKFAITLKSKGISTYCSYDKGKKLFRVFCSLTNSKESVYDKKKRLYTLGYNTIVQEIKSKNDNNYIK